MIFTEKPFKLLFAILLFFSSCTSQDNSGNTDTDSSNFLEVLLPDIAGYPIVDTNQSTFFDVSSIISAPAFGDDFHGQDAQYYGHQPSYTDNGDGTLIDNVTGLMWQQSFDHNNDGEVDYSDKLSYDEILDLLEQGVSFAGYDDWRLPTIKEMYSLIIFSGRDISPESTSTDNLIPFIDNETFEFAYGDLSAGERLIDMQCATTNVYVSNEVERTVFGVNFADGRIKGYGTSMPFGNEDKAFNYLLVRGRTDYGNNQFTDNGDGTVTDIATELMWMQNDSGAGMIWKDALSYAENFEFAGYSDWRLPNAKELQSIVDYSRSPASSNSAAMESIFNCTQITNEAGVNDYPWYWSGTTHASMNSGSAAAYVAFGRSLGNMNGWIDIHGAGSQRSDPKFDDGTDYSEGHGPQGDAIRIYNYVRLVRDIN